VPWGKSDLRAAYKAWWLKDWTTRWFGVFMQRCATPVPVGKFKRGTPQAQQTELLNVLNKLQSETALIMPDDVQSEFMQVAPTSHEAFLECLEWCDQQIASAIISQTLTSGEGSRVGSMALGKVHLDVLKANLRMMRERLTETINYQLIRRLIDYNFERRFYPTLGIIDFTDETLADWADSLFKVSNLPVQTIGTQDVQTIRDRLGLTAAWTEEDMIVPEPEPEPLAATDRTAGTAEAVSADQAV
jgi:phage gp29-like protein